MFCPRLTVRPAQRGERRLAVRRRDLAAPHPVAARPVLVGEPHFPTVGAVLGSKFALIGFDGFLSFSALTCSQTARW